MIIKPCLEGLPLRSIHFVWEGLVKSGQKPRQRQAAFTGCGSGIGIGNHRAKIKRKVRHTAASLTVCPRFPGSANA